MNEALQASKKFSEQEFYNSYIMSVGIGGPSASPELHVLLFKKIRTDNLPQTFDGIKVNYKFIGKVTTR